MIINLCSPRELTYRATNIDDTDKLEYILQFPSGYKHSFPAYLNKNTDEVKITLENLQEIAQEEREGMGYLLVTKSSGVITDMFKEQIKFAVSQVIELNKVENPGLNFNKTIEPINKMALKNDEVVVSHSKTLEFIMSNVDRNKK